MKTKLQAHANRAGVLEVRTLRGRELRTEKRDDVTYLTGYVANYGVLSSDFAGPKGKVWRERIKPGFFTRALAEQQDVRHLQNHDPNLVLGRTKAGTTELFEDEKGLGFRTRMGTRSYEMDLAESVTRGDVDEMSFGFVALDEKWTKEGGIEVRELIDGELFDISTVTYPAYPGTAAGIDSRAMFPNGAPLELRSRLMGPGAADRSAIERPAALARVQERRVASRGEVRAVTNSGGVLQLTFYGVIGRDYYWGDGISTQSVRCALGSAAPYSSICGRINSLGGDVFEGIAIYNLLRAQGKPIEMIIDGVAASTAAVVAMAGDTITMGLGAMMMIHCASEYVEGTAAELRATADYLDTCDAAIAEIFAARSGKPVEDILALMGATTWMAGQDCKDQGFCQLFGDPEQDPDADLDELLAEEAERSASLLAMYANVPEKLKAAVERRATERERRMRLRLAEVS